MTDGNLPATTRVTDPNQSLAKMLKDAIPALKLIAPKYVNLDRMTSLAIEAKMRNTLLEKCSPVSVLNFCKRCAETGTDRIGAGGMWAVPFWNKKGDNGKGCYDMMPMPDWRLIVEKAKKAKAITHATAEAVYENDTFSYERGLNPQLIHKPASADRGKLKAVYCVYVLPDGSKDFAVMDIAEDIEPIHKRSKAADAGPWVTDYAEMAKKTVVKRALKVFEGASIELTALIAADNIVTGYIDAEIVAPRAPVAMPRELPEPIPPRETPSSSVPETLTDAEEPQKQNAPSPETATDPKFNVRVIELVLDGVTESKTAKGKPYWFVDVGGTRYSTFDTTIGADLMKLNGNEVIISYIEKPNKNPKYPPYCDVQGVRAMVVGGQDAPAGDARE